MSNVPADKVYIQSDGFDFKRPLSESEMSDIGAAVNYAIQNLIPIGTIEISSLSEVQYQSEAGTQWILCDGRSIIGSDLYNLNNSFTNVPDMRGRFMRGKSYGNGLNPDGDLNVGTFQDQLHTTHVHNVDPVVFDSSTFPGTFPIITSSFQGTDATSNRIMRAPSDPSSYPKDSAQIQDGFPIETDGNIPSSTGENRPKNITLNFFIKVNRS